MGVVIRVTLDGNLSAMIGAFLAIALLSAGAEDLNLAAANESLDKAKIRHENVELLLREANVDILRGSVDLANSRLSEGISQYPFHVRLYWRRGALHLQAGRLRAYPRMLWNALF